MSADRTSGTGGPGSASTRPARPAEAPRHRLAADGPGGPDDSGGPGGRGQVVLGIDAGGSSIRARAVCGGEVVHDGRGGAGNPLAVGEAELRDGYRRALAGCPRPDRVAACVAGAGAPETRALLRELLGELLPGADVRVAPDYVAAFLAAPDGTDLCVLSGTGSLVCSPAPRDDRRHANGDAGSVGRGVPRDYRVSGGRGWLLGDHGSASRLGRAALEWYVAREESAPDGIRAAVAALFGSAEWRGVVRVLQGSPTPARLLARAAPVLTAAAEQGAVWARQALRAEMAALAETAARHVAAHLPRAADGGGPPLRVALAGGVWASSAARDVFDRELAAACPWPASTVRSVREPVEGAVRLAAYLAC